MGDIVSMADVPRMDSFVMAYISKHWQQAGYIEQKKTRCAFLDAIKAEQAQLSRMRPDLRADLIKAYTLLKRRAEGGTNY